jgi:hypothetical protein
MPICCEPGERFPIVLDCDKGKTPEPTFWCRHLSARKFQAMTKIGQRMAETGDLDKQLDLLSEALEMTLCGWDNLTDPAGTPIPFDVIGIMDLLTIAEGAELFSKSTSGQHVSGSDAKKSDSPSPSDSDSTAAVEDQGLVEIAPMSPLP